MPDKVRVGISIGDLNGIGLEVILKTLDDDRIFDQCIPVIYGSSKVVSYHKNIVKEETIPFQNLDSAERLNPEKINVVNCWQENVNITLGKITEVNGKYSYISMDSALKDIKKGLVDVLVTAPINKAAMQKADFPYEGHTEFLTDKLDVDISLMMMVSDDMKVGLVTGHMPIKAVPGKISKSFLRKKLDLLHSSLIQDFGMERPVIGLLGLNPHAGERGMLGTEEQDTIQPVIDEAKEEGLMVMGPYAADGFFGSGEYKKVDGILAMYHDQGLIPFKALCFEDGVNYTAGLPIVRTSPDHGTAYAIAGKGTAKPDSFRKALFTAIDIFRQRKMSVDDVNVKDIKKPKPSEETTE